LRQTKREVEIVSVRKIVEKLSRGKILKRKIRVNGNVVPLYVSPDSQLKYLKPGSQAFDQDLIVLAEKHLTEDSVVWDVGANVGVFTFAAASIARLGSVLAIEADVWLASVLRRSAQFGQYADRDIKVLPAAVSNTNSVASFMIAERGRASNALEVAGGRSQMGGVRSIDYVPTLTLDTLLETFGPPTFVKIDVEGAELLAIEGAQTLINSIRPTFYIEVGEDLSLPVFEMFESANYAAFDQDGKLLTERCATNTLFVPN